VKVYVKSKRTSFDLRLPTGYIYNMQLMFNCLRVDGKVDWDWLSIKSLGGELLHQRDSTTQLTGPLIL